MNMIYSPIFPRICRKPRVKIVFDCFIMILVPLSQMHIWAQYQVPVLLVTYWYQSCWPHTGTNLAGHILVPVLLATYTGINLAGHITSLAGHILVPVLLATYWY